MEQIKQSFKVTSKTIEEAISQISSCAEQASRQNRIDLTVELIEDVYTLTSPIILSTLNDPGLEFVNLNLIGVGDIKPTITSCKPITETYTRVEGKPYYKCQLKKGEDGKYPRFHDLYLNGKRLSMATSQIWLNKEVLTKEERGAGHIRKDGVYFCDDDTVSIDRRGLYVPIDLAKSVAESESQSTEMCMYIQWEHYTLRVTGVDLDETNDIDGETYALIKFDDRFAPHFVRGLHRANNIMNRVTFFRNDLAFLTKENSYVYDWNNGTLYFIVGSEDVLKNNQLMYATSESLIEVYGLSNFSIQNITFTGVSSSFICDNGYYALLSNVERSLTFKGDSCDRFRHSAIVTSFVRNFTVRNCVFKGIGCNAIQMCDRTVRAEISDNIFVDVAMSAVSIGNPTGQWDKAENQSYAISVLNNYFEHIAYDYPNCAVIFIGISDGSEIKHNTIKGCAYSGIFGGWGWSNVDYELGEGVNIRDTEISHNKIVNFMELCRDGAAIYMTGANSKLSCDKRFNIIHDNFAILENEGDSYMRGYYLDGATTNYEVFDNVIVNCKLPLFTQYHVPSQYTHHITSRGIYSTTSIDSANHNPDNDVLLESFFVEEKDLLFKRYPKAEEIAQKSGCNLKY